MSKITNPKLKRMHEYFDNLKNNTPEQNIKIAIRNSILSENEDIENSILNENINKYYVCYEYTMEGYATACAMSRLRSRPIYPITMNIGEVYNIKNSETSTYNFNNFSQFKSGNRSSNSMEGIKGLR